MLFFSHLFMAVYLSFIVLLSLYGLHRYWILYLYFRYHKWATPPVMPAMPLEWPKVTVQLPVYNERYVVERLIDAACRLDYPREKLEIQVLDDSTDDTPFLIERHLVGLKEQGFCIEHLRRSERTGYKAGALAAGVVLGLCRLAVATPSGLGEYQDSFRVDKADLAPTGRNPYFILESGYQMRFESAEGKKKASLTVTVTGRTEEIDGVQTRVVEERETADGTLIEVSRNFFAISKTTNDLYYFGEDVDIYKNGKIANHEGAWRSGTNGAHFGLMLTGKPAVGARFYQELAPKVAMDRVEIVSLTETVQTPSGKFEKCLKTEETTPLEPGTRSYKIFAPGVGLVQDGSLLLTGFGKVKASE